MAWGRPVAWVAVGALGGIAACSSTSGSPGGKVLDPPDHLYVDVDGSTPPDQPDGDLGPDSPFAPVDGSAAYGDSYDAYAVLTVCPPPSSDGGAHGGVDGGGADGEAPAGERDGAAYSADGGAMAQGCQPLPADCVSQPTCDCLLRVLAAETPCAYAHCSVGMDKGFSLYCP
jgi:hypothetical protein